MIRPSAVEILAEVGACHRLVQLALNERLIGLVNNAIGVGVGDEETKRNVSMRLPVAVDVLRMQSYNLGLVTPVSCAVMLLPLKVMAPTVAVPPMTVTSPDVTGASKVKTAL